MAGEGGGESEVDLVDADRCRQVDLGVPQVELEVLTVLRQARIVRAGAVRRDLSRGHRRDWLRARAGDFATATPNAGGRIPTRFSCVALSARGHVTEPIQLTNLQTGEPVSRVSRRMPRY